MTEKHHEQIEDIDKWKDYRRALLKLQEVEHRLTQAERVITVLVPENIEILAEIIEEATNKKYGKSAEGPTEIVRDIRMWAKVVKTYKREYMYK